MAETKPHTDWFYPPQEQNKSIIGYPDRQAYRDAWPTYVMYTVDRGHPYREPQKVLGEMKMKRRGKLRERERNTDFSFNL